MWSLVHPRQRSSATRFREIDLVIRSRNEVKRVGILTAAPYSCIGWVSLWFFVFFPRKKQFWQTSKLKQRKHRYLWKKCTKRYQEHWFYLWWIQNREFLTGSRQWGIPCRCYTWLGVWNSRQRLSGERPEAKPLTAVQDATSLWNAAASPENRLAPVKTHLQKNLMH